MAVDTDFQRRIVKLFHFVLKAERCCPLSAPFV